ncbi:MAG: YfhO family protein, partial [Bacteroidia bacterium]|nr:YfhO family protein [Bacteroidia bacterium]
KFRAVKMTLIITDFLLPFMAILGINEVVKNPGILREKQKEFFAAFTLTGGLSLLFYLLPDTFFSFDYLNPAISNQILDALQQNGMDQNAATSWMAGMQSSLEAVRVAVFKADALRSFLLILLGAATIWVFDRFKLPALVLAIVCGVFITGDLFSVDKRYVNSKDFVPVAKAEIPFMPSEADEAIYQMELAADPSLSAKIKTYQSERTKGEKSKMQRSAAEDAKYRFRALLANTDYRVLNLTARAGIFNDAATSFFHKSVGGYSAAKLERYQEFIEFHLDSNIRGLYGILNSRPSDSMLKEQMGKLYAFNMLNTRYIIYNEKAPPLVNPAALGNAWFVSSIKTVKNADEEITTVGKVNPAEVAIVDERFAEQVKAWSPAPDSNATITLNSYAPNRLVYSSQAASTQLAVFSEIYYANGWKAFVDGKETQHFRTNYILRGMLIPAGKHEIEFRFEPAVYSNTEMISYAASSLLLAVALAFLAFYFRNSTKAEAK